MTPGALTAIAVSLLSAVAEPVARAAPEPRAETPGALSSLESEQSSLFARVAPSVVLLTRDGVSGSGFIVGKDGLILTNAHVVGEGNEVTVRLTDGRHGLGRVIARATGALDLALVKAPFDGLPPLEAGDPGALRAGSFAATVGHGGGAAWTFSTGLVANPRPLGDGAPLLLAQMALRPGSSGGPLVDRLGRAVAVVTAGTRDASGVTFAIRIDAALAAFPQLEPWAASTIPSGPHPDALGATEERREPAVETARTDPVPGTAEVAQLAGAGAARPGPAAEAESKGSAMITVWEAPHAGRRVAARPTPRRATVASHAGAQLPTRTPPVRSPPLVPPAVLLLAAVLTLGAVASRVGAGSRAPR